MTLFLVRHAMPQVDPAVDPAQWPLSDQGRQDASAVGTQLPVGAQVVASDELKAAETVALAARVDLDKVRQDPAFGEVIRPGEPFDDHHRERRLAWVDRRPDERHRRWETPSAAAARFQHGLDQLDWQVEDVVVGTHGMVMTAWLAETGRLPRTTAATYWAALPLPAIHVIA